RKKGISVVGTGDFTHPAWMAEMEEKLVPAEPGLFRLRPDLEREVESWLDVPDAAHTRFLLEVEISTIYKKGDKTRKVHHLVYAPDLEKAREISRRLARIGNIASDGRPILGLDSRDLLEITLESGDDCFLIPAHIWTPWFAALGSKSGFDSIPDCYGDLSDEIFAVETGLSSDPEMNGLLSALDRYTLVSNSDAHSPPKLGREACVFESDMNYFAMRDAMKDGDGFGGTVEFFPEEGKYHMDGHRKCGVRFTPEESKEHDGRCPECGKPLTLGVMHRVCELADRKPEDVPERDSDFRSLIPLDEVISEIQGVGPKSKRVRQSYESLVGRLGSELSILDRVPVEDVERAGSPRVAEALSRMREGQVTRLGGYDGEYGRIRIFTDEELAQGRFAGLLVDLSEITPEPKPAVEPKEKNVEPSEPKTAPAETVSSSSSSAEIGADESSRSERIDDAPLHLRPLDPDQRRAASVVKGPLLVVAGPGTGKTRTLVQRLAHMVEEHAVDPSTCLAITFTRRAAEEMRERLDELLGERARPMTISTFHSLGRLILREQSSSLNFGAEFSDAGSFRIASEEERLDVLTACDLGDVSIRQATQELSRAKRGESVGDEVSLLRESYDRELRSRGCIDFDDLLVLSTELLEGTPEIAEHYRERFQYISVDEYQDIDAVQYRLLRCLVPSRSTAPNLCAIGDPDQSIYRFRGSDLRFFQRFEADFVGTRRVVLTRNYRSTKTIVDAALQVIAPASFVPGRELAAQSGDGARIEVWECASDRAEAETVVHSIEKLVGGSSFFSLDSSRVESHEGDDLSFSDIAVLYRTDAVSEALAEAFARSGIPFQKRSHGRLAEQAAVRQLAQNLRAPQGSGEEEGGSMVTRLTRAIEALQLSLPEIEAYAPALTNLASQHDRDDDAFFDALELGVDVDLWDPRAQCVSLMTLHASKGLEFPYVFICGCEEGLLPFSFGPEPDEDEVEEERRLFFVGVTRAKRRLFLSSAKRRMRRGHVEERSPSPFLADLERRLIETKKTRESKPAPNVRQLTLFD
ncbi:MAG: UvrD-helicase domain-containing protein, partial [Planctomycetota bacterium]